METGHGCSIHPSCVMAEKLRGGANAVVTVRTGTLWKCPDRVEQRRLSQDCIPGFRRPRAGGVLAVERPVDNWKVVGSIPTSAIVRTLLRSTA